MHEVYIGCEEGCEEGCEKGCKEGTEVTNYMPGC